MKAVIHAAIMGRTGRSQLAGVLGQGRSTRELNGGVGSFFIEPDKTIPAPSASWPSRPPTMDYSLPNWRRASSYQLTNRLRRAYASTLR